MQRLASHALVLISVHVASGNSRRTVCQTLSYPVFTDTVADIGDSSEAVEELVTP